MALPVLALGTVLPTKAMVSAIMTEAPRPCTARAATSSHRVGARAHRMEAMANSAMPASSRRRRPSMSPRRPTLTIRAVMASRYASTIHCTSWNGACRALAMSGKPTLAMLVPSAGSSIARDRLASAPRTGIVALPVWVACWSGGTGFDGGCMAWWILE